MRYTRISVTIFYILGLSVAICTAFPIQPIEHSNQFLVGVVAFFTIGFAATACLCCRRRKHGFEEFVNESGGIDANTRYETPIFRAISTQNYVRTVTDADQEVSHTSETNQNTIITNNPLLINNGIHCESKPNIIDSTGNAGRTAQCTEKIPIIENESNAFSITSTPNILHDETNQPIFDSHPLATHQFDPLNHILQNTINYTLTTNQYQNESPHVETIISMPEINPIVNTIRVESIDDSRPLNDSFQIDIESNSTNNLIEKNHKSISMCATVPFVVSSQNEKDSSVVSTTSQPTLDDDCPLQTSRKISTNSNAATSDDASSVEEALRALDMAIADEEFMSTDLEGDENSDECQDDQQDDEDLQQEFSELLVKNCANRFSDYPQPNSLENADDDDDDDNDDNEDDDDGTAATILKDPIDHKVENRIKIEDVFEQAKALVDGVIFDCENYFQQMDNLNDIDPVSEGDFSMQMEIANETQPINRNNTCDFSQIQNNCELNVDTCLSRLSSEEITGNSTNCKQNIFKSEDSTKHIYCDKNSKVNEIKSEYQVDPVIVNDTKLIDESSDLIPTTIDSTINSESNDVLTDLLDDSMNEAFIGNLAASTPCVKPNAIQEHGTGVQSRRNLLNRLSDGNCVDVRPSVNIEPLQQTFNVTYDANCDRKCDTTYTNANDQTFAKDSNNSGTFCVVNKTEIVETLSDTIVLITEPPRLKIDHDDVNSVDLNTATPLNTPIELNYMNYTWDKFEPNQNDLQAPKSLPTILPSNDFATENTTETSWFDDQFPPSDGTFVRAVDGTFNFDDHYDNNDADDNSFEGENDEANENQDLDFTLNELRKQLTLTLPHASGSGAMSTLPVNQTDDDDDDDDTLEESYKEREGSPEMEQQPEIIINYRRQLSPIIEESDEDTCRTFHMNETGPLDSTSTGCVETAEAIMGVTKVLMASNDTLFNFEDTLGDRDRDDMLLSPRNQLRTNSNTTSTESSLIIEGQNLLRDDDDSNSSDLNTFHVHDDVQVLKENLKSLDFKSTIDEATVQVINDLLSPEQQKTFSEDIQQLSSDLSGTVEATYTANTLDDLKTCISVHSKDESQNDKDLLESIGDNLSSSSVSNLIIQDIITTNHVPTEDYAENVQLTSNDDRSCMSDSNHPIVSKNDIIANGKENSNQNDDRSEMELPNTIDNSSQEFANDTKENENPNILKVSDEKSSTYVNAMDKNTIMAVEVLTHSDASNITDSVELTKLKRNVVSIHSHALMTETDIHNEQKYLFNGDNITGHLSGENDPWANSYRQGTDVCVKDSNLMCEQNEWDSDIEDSNSSEEFMYVRNVSPPTRMKHEDMAVNFNKETSTDEYSDNSTHQYNPSNSVWNSHEDKVQIMNKADDHEEIGEQELPEDSSSDVEGEWVPSSWSSLAQPSRSALKSPDKSTNGYNKNRRNVVFKKQNYHSVYVYPKEMTALSPAYSEPQMASAYSVSTLFASADEAEDGEVEGFNISSSTRPFGSQFNTQCHTWPTDSDFSWSKLQDSDLGKDSFSTYSDLPTEWPKKFAAFYYQNEDSKYGKDEEYTRADSGVGESAEILSESMSLGDLCHTKASLRLPIKPFPIAALDAANDKLLFPTNRNDDELSTNDSEFPVASIDSQYASSSSVVNSADRPLSLSSFDHLSNECLSNAEDNEKIPYGSKSDDITSLDDVQVRLKSPEIPVPATEPDIITSDSIVSKENNIEYRSKKGGSKKINEIRSSARQSDSTDEDSGIESIIKQNNF